MAARATQGRRAELKAPAEATPETITEALRAFRGVGQQRSAGADAAAAPVDCHRRRRKPRNAHRARHERPAIRRAAGRLLVESSLHFRRIESARGPACRQLRARSHSAACARTLRRLVLASAKHPAMLAYLDNFQSIGPASPGAQRPWRSPASRAGPRAQRKLRARVARVAHARRGGRVHAAGRPRAGENPDGLDDCRLWWPWRPSADAAAGGAAGGGVPTSR